MPKELEDLLDELSVEVRAMKARRGSRYAGAGADPAVIDHLAEGGAVERGTGKRVGRSYGTKSAGGDEDWRRLVEPGRSGSSGGSLAKAILDIKLHRTEGMRAVWDDKALAEATDTAGGFLLEPEIAQDVMMLIRNRAATLKLKVTTVNPRSKRFDLPGLAAGASASWLAENAALPASAQTFQIAAQMVPRPIGGLVAISNRLLADATAENQWSAGSVDDVIKRDIADLIAVTLDNGLINGGTNAPTGILNTTGTTPLSGVTIPTNGFSFTSPPGGTSPYGLLVAIVNSVRQANMPFSSPGWLFAPRTLQSLENLTNAYGEPLLASAGLLTINAQDGTSGMLMGFPFFTTNNVPINPTYGTANNASTIVFASDWSEAFFGDWQSLAIDSSSEASYTPDGGTTWISAYQSQQTLTRATAWCDFTIRRPAAFCVVKGILP